MSLVSVHLCVLYVSVVPWFGWNRYHRDTEDTEVHREDAGL